MDESSVLTNRCVMDQATIRKTYARIYRRNLMLFYLGSGLMAAFSLLLILLQGTLSPLPGFLLLAAGVYLFIGLRQPGKQAKLQLLRYEQSGGSASPEVTVRFREEELTARREGLEDPTHISYNELQSILLDGSRIILWTEEKQFIVLDPARFENGSEAAFWKLMNEKRPDLVPKNHRG
jgi:hypothetical protein